MRVSWEETFAQGDGDYDRILRPTGFARAKCAAFSEVLPSAVSRSLEVGSGSGQITIAMALGCPSVEFVGLDISSVLTRASSAVVQKAGIRNAVFVTGDMFELPFADGTFSLVFSEGVIEHFDEWEAAAREHVRVCEPGGTVAISVPNTWNLPHTCYKWLYRRKHGVDCEYGMEKSFTAAELRALAERLGLVDIQTRGFAAMYGLDRLMGRRPWLRGSRFFHPVFNLLDRVSRGAMTDWFGYEVLCYGKKPREDE